MNYSSNLINCRLLIQYGLELAEIGRQMSHSCEKPNPSEFDLFKSIDDLKRSIMDKLYDIDRSEADIIRTEHKGRKSALVLRINGEWIVVANNERYVVDKMDTVLEKVAKLTNKFSSQDLHDESDDKHYKMLLKNFVKQNRAKLLSILKDNLQKACYQLSHRS